MRTRKGLNVVNYNNETIFQLYNTIILVKTMNGFKLNSGGWKTNHTKNCINDNLPTGYKVFQKDFTWYIQTPLQVVEFFDNMVVNHG